MCGGFLREDLLQLSLDALQALSVRGFEARESLPERIDARRRRNGEDEFLGRERSVGGGTRRARDVRAGDAVFR